MHPFALSATHQPVTYHSTTERSNLFFRANGIMDSYGPPLSFALSTLNHTPSSTDNALDGSDALEHENVYWNREVNCR